jgi:hypothetical protein
MTVSDTGVVDFIGIDNATGGCILTISDHLPWDDEDHLRLLQEKFNTYLRFVESGELFETYPQAEGKPISISVAMKFSPSGAALNFLEEARKLVAEAGFSLAWSRIEGNDG